MLKAINNIFVFSISFIRFVYKAQDSPVQFAVKLKYFPCQRLWTCYHGYIESEEREMIEQFKQALDALQQLRLNDAIARSPESWTDAERLEYALERL